MITAAVIVAVAGISMAIGNTIGSHLTRESMIKDFELAWSESLDVSGSS